MLEIIRQNTQSDEDETKNLEELTSSKVINALFTQILGGYADKLGEEYLTQSIDLNLFAIKCMTQNISLFESKQVHQFIQTVKILNSDDPELEENNQ